MTTWFSVPPVLFFNTHTLVDALASSLSSTAGCAVCYVGQNKLAKSILIVPWSRGAATYSGPPGHHIHSGPPAGPLNAGAEGVLDQ